SLIGRFITGKYVNKIGPKRILIIGLILLIITQLLYFIEGALAVLMFTRLVNGIATGLTTTATGTIAAYATPQEKNSKDISFVSFVFWTFANTFISHSILMCALFNLR